MRNWNPSFSTWFRMQSTRSQTTYEELKLVLSQHSNMDHSAPRLPMRNWNFSFTSKVSPSSRAPRLPMRNWNSDGALRYLRHLRAPRLPMRNWNIESIQKIRTKPICSQTTYEELKLAYGDADSFDRWGSQTTYEELKQTTVCHWQPLASNGLPDYLWGIETLQKQETEEQFTSLPDYLWGIETLFWSIVHAKRAQLPDYLWGIET